MINEQIVAVVANVWLIEKLSSANHRLGFSFFTTGELLLSDTEFGDNNGKSSAGLTALRAAASYNAGANTSLRASCLLAHKRLKNFKK